MNIVPMQERHLAAIAAIERACFAAPWSEQALREELSNSHALFLTGEEDGTVCGYIGCHTVLDEGYITNVAVTPAARRHGVGAALVGALLEEAEARQLSFVTLEVRASNAAAIALYEKMEFQAVGRRRNFYQNPAEDAVLMTRTWHDNTIH